MKKTILLIAMFAIVIIASSAVCIAAPPPPDGSYSNPPVPGGSQYPSYPPGYPNSGNQPYPPTPPGQQGQNYQNNTNNNQQNYVNHPSYGPTAGQQPQYTPSASTGQVAENFAQGQPLTSNQLSQLGGAPQSSKATTGGQAKAYLLISGLEMWAYYNGQWTKDPTAVYFNGRMNLVVNNDQGQYLWSYDRYPSGYEDWHYWGYLNPGYYNILFAGDMSGWHQIATWGSQSGWSNVLWIYVY